ncbi:hypothetical protein E3N88_28762 [Mikania micrantha]|uniref:Protein kinase domain-containing protein n=1 Tax=Mikania micrantha TaxID=192012 RepID=A0A5N6N0Y7_9ASTR|nr:hypothetical protein E3N88_28762 [Mikania micrantha]
MLSFRPVTVVYTLGMILLEVLYGRKTMSKDANEYRAKMVLYQNYEEGKQLQDMIAPNLTQMHPQSLYIFARTVSNCLKKHPGQDMDQIVNGLEEAFDIQWKHENALWMEKFAYLRIPLRQIKLATDDFADTYRINIYHDVYKAELNNFDRESALTIEEQNKDELPKKTVVIKRINKQNKTTKDFFAEIEMLTSYTTSLWRSRPENFRTWLLGHRLVVDDIYSLGVILYEILTRRLAYDPFYMEDKINRLRHLDAGKLKSMADPRIMEEAEYSLGTFSEITCRCLTLETLNERPTFEDVIKSLEKALHIQPNSNSVAVKSCPIIKPSSRLKRRHKSTVLFTIIKSREDHPRLNSSFVFHLIRKRTSLVLCVFLN